MHTTVRLFVVVSSLLAMVGCGGNDIGSLNPVDGKVTVQGRPVPSGAVSFWPKDDRLKRAAIVGRITNGRYSMQTNGEIGVPAGTYNVTVVASSIDTATLGADDPSKTANISDVRIIDPRYKNVETSKLKITVTENPAAGVYDLQLSP